MLGVAVSGGADSIYLLHEMLARGEPLVVLHVNHRLRGEESEADERFVRALGHPTRVLIAPVPPGNLEQGARQARREWFQCLLREGVVNRIALGHTRSDQAETVLFHFLRGAGTAGLAGMLPETEGGLVRPLLHLTREEIRESLRSRGIPWREDSSNRDLRFSRNRLRMELLPLLNREWNPRIEQSLAQTALWAQGEEAFWTAEMERLAPEYMAETPEGLILRWPGSLPLAVRRRLVRHAILQAKGDLRQVEFGHVEQILGMRSGRVCLPGLVVERSFEWLRMGALRVEPANFPYSLLESASGGSPVLQIESSKCVYNVNEHQLDWGRVAGRLELRNWRPGDRYRRVGNTNEEKIKLLFQKARIPVWERQAWPVLMCGGRIAWTRLFGAAAEFAPGPGTGTVLIVREVLRFPNRNL